MPYTWRLFLFVSLCAVGVGPRWRVQQDAWERRAGEPVRWFSRFEVYRLLGCEPGAYPAAFQTLTRFTHPDDRAALEAEYARAFDPDLGGFFETEHRIVTPEGEVRTLHQRAQVTFDEIGRPVRIFGTSQDVTERRQLESELRRLNQELEHRVAARTAELEQVNRDLESFSYSVSHDLRAPLRHVQGYIAMFERSLRVPLDADAQARLAVIGEAARRMGTLIDSLLAFSRIGRAAMHYCTVELDTLIREVISELEPDTEGREIAWNIEPLPKVMADRNLLRLVLTNLVSNALKFTRGRPSARIDIGSAVVAGERIFRIHDNGVGFDMQYAGKLRYPDYIIAGQIANMRNAGNRCHMMLAVRLERYALQQHDLVIAANLMENAREMISRIFGIALAIFLPCARHTPGCIDKPLALWVVSGPADDSAHRVLNFGRNRNLGGLRFPLFIDHLVHSCIPACLYARSYGQ